MKKSYIISLAVLFCVTGCDDRAFLKETLETSYVKDNIFSGSDQVELALVSCYTRAKNIFLPDGNGTAGNVWSYSKGDGTDMFDVATIRYGDRMNDYSILNSQSNIYRNTYYKFYELIADANLTLELTEENFDWPSPQDKAYVVAQAKFFRAFAYRNLGELFGGVPLVTKVETSPRFDYVRSTREQTYQFAIDDLEAALNDLPVTHTQAGRIVRAAAQHNLCQLYLDLAVIGANTQASYAKALQYANDVIEGGTYGLMTERFGARADQNPEFYYAQSAALSTADHSYSSAGYPIAGNVYWDLFQEGNQDFQRGNKEAIWVAQCDFAAWEKEGGTRDLLGLLYPLHFGPVTRDQGGEHYKGQWIDAGGFGIVRSMPTPYARDGVYADKWGDDLRNSDAVLRRTVLGNVPASSMYGKKLSWDMLYRVESPTEGGAYPWNDAAYTQLFPLSVKINPDVFRTQGNSLQRIFRDEYMIRLPETILLRAEIKWRTGDSAGAAEDINKLRSRAQCGYLVTAADVGLDLILDERARELIYEESRWNTLMRMGGSVALDRVGRYAYWKYPLIRTFDLWPIPQAVIDVNKDAVMEQNEGW